MSFWNVILFLDSTNGLFSWKKWLQFLQINRLRCQINMMLFSAVLANSNVRFIEPLEITLLEPQFGQQVFSSFF